MLLECHINRTKKYLEVRMLKTISNFIYKIGLELLTNKIQNTKNSKEIKLQLQDFIEKKQELFKDITLDEEFDFQGLAEYILKQLPNEIDKYIYGTSESQRKVVADTIINKAINYAKPNTSQGKKYVETLILQCIQLLRDFYITTYFDSKTNLVISEVIQAVGKEIANDGDKTRNAIAQIQSKSEAKEDSDLGRRVDMMNAINSLKLPDYTREEIPRIIYPHNPQIEVNELDVFFDNDSIKSKYRLLQDKIKAMEGLVYELKEFHNSLREPDGEGSFQYLIWDEIIKKEDILIKSNYAEEVENDFEEFCNKNEMTKFIEEINEPVTYNYYIITKKMEQTQQEFEELKVSLVNQMKCHIQRIIK